jgi:3-oxoacyl-[acyl-carrier protein] reductase
MSYPGNSVLVTGAGQGIGQSIAEELLVKGLNVVILELHADLAEATVSKLQASSSQGASIISAVGSVTSPEAISAAFDAGESAFGGPIQMVVNNAGGSDLCLLKDMSDQLWNNVIELNLTAPFLCLREFARRLLDAQLPGSAVSISSLNYVAATDGLGPYCAAKAGLSQLTKVSAAEWGRYGIRTNAVAPGSIQTPRVAELELLAGRLGEEFMIRTPLGRFGAPEDVARAVSFLLSDESSWITGVTLGVDGGQAIRGLPSYWDVLAEEQDSADS